MSYEEWKRELLSKPGVSERLDAEIKRLHQLVREAHELRVGVYEVDAYETPTSYGPWCLGCMWNHYSIPDGDPGWEVDEFFSTMEEAVEAHSQHVTELLGVAS